MGSAFSSDPVCHARRAGVLASLGFEPGPPRLCRFFRTVERFRARVAEMLPKVNAVCRNCYLVSQLATEHRQTEEARSAIEHGKTSLVSAVTGIQARSL